MNRKTSLTITDEQRRYRLAIRHRLCEHRLAANPESVADSLVAIHSTDPATVYLSVNARMKKPDVKKILRSIVDRRSLVRFHSMRATIWVMTFPVARLAHAAATAKIASKSRSKTVEAIERSVDAKDADKWLNDSTRKIKRLLDQNGAMTAREIGQALPELVVPLKFGAGKNSGTMNAHTQVLQQGGYEGELVRGSSKGSWTSGEYVWSSFDNWSDQSLTGADESESAASLLLLWLNQFGPATLTDIRWYFGWTAKLTRDSLDTIQAESVLLENGSEAFVSPGDTSPVEDPGHWMQLLPALDATTMGWKERSFYFDEQINSGLFDRSGNAGPAIWVDGHIAGSWIQKPDGSIAYNLNRKLSRHQQKLLNEVIDRTVAYCGDVVVRPRFPAPIQKSLLAT